MVRCECLGGNARFLCGRRRIRACIARHMGTPMRSARAHGDHSVQQDVEKQDGVPGPSVHPRATHTAQACHPDLHALFWGGRKGNLAQKQFASLLPLLPLGLTSVTDKNLFGLYSELSAG